VVFSFSVHAIQDELPNGVKGIWFKPNEKEEQSFLWKAQWIWVDETFEEDVILARRSFELNELPGKAFLRITASSQYQLYINGEYICRGPARCAPHHQSYDIFEISGLLKKNKNVIAVRVHFQKGKTSYQHSGRAGLLVQLDFGENNNFFITDSTWKVAVDKSWDKNAPKISRFQQVVNDRVDFRKYQKSWNEIAFDDSEWINAIPLMRNVGWPAPQKNAQAQALTPPWTSLVPRDVPYLVETEIKADNLIEAKKIETSVVEGPVLLNGSINLDFDQNLPPELPACSSQESWLLIYDFEKLINGSPKIEVQGETGTEIEIITAPFIVDNKFTHKTVDSEFLDKIVLSGKNDNWDATYFKPTRFLALVVRNRAPVKINSVGIRQFKYPFVRHGFIESSDAPWIKKYMNATAKTINACTTDAFTDNYRERRQYAQTGYYGALGNYWLFGDYQLQRRYLVQVAQEQLGNGLMPAYAPAAAADFMVILDSNCLWIRSLRNYLLYSGDFTTTRGLLPAAKKLMALLNSFTNPSGMIDNPPFPYWLDHAMNDRRGANMNLNGHYLGTLEDFAELLNWLDEPGSEEFQERAGLLRQSLQTCLWDEKKQLFADAFVDGNLSAQFSEQANAMALAMNVATAEQAKLVAQQLLVTDKHNYILRESGIIMVTPAMSYFLHKGLCNYGFIDESLQMFRSRFDKMLQPEKNGTLWEEWWLDGTGRSGKLQKGRTRSDAQTESAFPPALFAEYLLGIQPTQPGMKEVVITKTNSKIKSIKGSVPTPQGILEISWNISENKGFLNINIPDISVKLDLASMKIYTENRIKLNGERLDSNAAREKYMELTKGNYEIEF